MNLVPHTTDLLDFKSFFAFLFNYYCLELAGLTANVTLDTFFVVYDLYLFWLAFDSILGAMLVVQEATSTSIFSRVIPSVPAPGHILNIVLPR